MSWVAVGVGVGTLAVGAVSADNQADAAKDAANAQTDASRYATDIAHQEYEQTRQDLMPWMDAGRYALTQQQNFLNGDYGAALNSPFYKASLEEGFKGLDMGATARGNLWGGGTDADRIRLGQNLASSQLQSTYNAWAALSQTGQITANQLGGYGQNFAQQAGNNAMNAANARASSYLNGANAWANFGNQLVGTAGQFAGMYNNNYYGGG